ncbi:MAG: DUF4238 domain-containing protein [Chthonomonadaceae bacterium]|nr:DUF4238 domain-containing protein [Chthonomonadaceae bacterium]
MSDQRSKKHHTIPQFLLREFTDDRGILNEFDLDYLKRTERRPSQVSHTDEFYTIFRDGEPSDEVERLLSRFESDVRPALARICDPALPLEEADLDMVAMMVALQKQRVPSRRRQMWAFLDDVEEKSRMVAAAHGLDVERATENVRNEVAFTRTGDFMNPQMLSSLLPIYRLMRRRGWTVVSAPKEGPTFVISEDPVVITDLRPDTGPPYFPLIPYSEDSLLTMPIGSGVALVSYFDPVRTGRMELEQDFVGLMNRWQMRTDTTRVYGRGPELYWGRLNGRALGWDDFIEDQREARAATGWTPAGRR